MVTIYGREYSTSNPDGVKNLITKGVKKVLLFEQALGNELGRVLKLLAFVSIF
ncbi:histidine phosphatase family protein [Riemerella anatipestifer]|uniref:Uncharacterized protein n=1 Tax=Riemerella anatipestifer TaxID=34085 RepID=A0AAP3ANU9_RIEAN|nr:hypothetical protein [Riemerella anatipestifer]MBT0551833.1 hypothetical protein [Riemerella anatipestifer]MBT0554083.1 hypothetical protein [Riemerella anatipestifer]MBT0572641.1 hypothetical protein [Riemerella anatipestifer]MCE3024682.1 hypothetical protein [Riemerella anatipestifer]MCQ4181317.1 hypothetical protein [Riemerella anatipestifer]